MRNKTFIVFWREYIQRIKSKAFILSTILGPLALFALIFIPIATTVLLDDDTTRTIYVVDQDSLDLSHLTIPGNGKVVESDLPEDSLKAMIRSGSIDGYLLLPNGVTAGTASAKYASRGGTGIQFRIELERSIESIVRTARLERAGVGDTVVQIIESNVPLEGVRVTQEGEGADSTGFLSIFGYIMAMTIYISVFLYGSLVMRSVIEEKTNRIVEVVVSSVRPFQLMLGKVLGVGAVGVTQILIWFVMIGVGASVGGIVLGAFLPAREIAEAAEATGQPEVDFSQFQMPHIPFSFFVYFVLFFLLGYLLYASLFATIGSVVEQESDAQQFMLPIVVPIIFSLLLLGRVIDSPGSTLSVVASYIPFFSPILMPVRGVVTSLAFWEMPLALLILAATFTGAIWLCARVYRIGILMYGKRPSFSDIIRWARVD